MDTGVNLKRCIENRTSGGLCGLRRHIFARSDIHRPRGEVVPLEIITKVIDGILHLILRVCPTAAVIGIATVCTYIADCIRLRICIGSRPYEQ